MSWTNYHTHSDYCDGVGSLEAYIFQAISCHMPMIGFSSHAPVDLNSDWHMLPEGLNPYLEELKVLKKKHQGEISIYTGLEVDYIKGVTGPKNFRDKELDFIIGSIHYVGQFNNGNYCSIEETQAGFERGLEEIFHGDVKALVRTYYDHLISMVKTDPPDIIGHLDIIKKLNDQNRYFDENNSWYRSLITEVIEDISKSHCIVELNTRGYYKGITPEPYPGKWILEKCLEYKLPITLSSDAHRPEEIDQGLEMAAGVLLDIGYRHIQVFNGKGWSAAPLNRTGIEIDQGRSA